MSDLVSLAFLARWEKAGKVGKVCELYVLSQSAWQWW
jgi:hypothetical protein